MGFLAPSAHRPARPPAAPGDPERQAPGDPSGEELDLQVKKLSPTGLVASGAAAATAAPQVRLIFHRCRRAQEVNGRREIGMGGIVGVVYRFRQPQSADAEESRSQGSEALGVREFPERPFLANRLASHGSRA